MATLPLSLYFGVGTFNIRNLPDLTRAEVRQCASIVSAQAGMVGFQEIAEVEDDEDLDAVLLPASWIHEGYNSENAIMAKRSRFRIATKEELNGVEPVAQKQLSPGLAHVTPSRNLVWTVFKFVENGVFTPVALVNTHLVSGVHAGSDHLTERQAFRDQEFAGIQKWVAYLVDNGINVIFTADTNWKDMPAAHGDWTWLVNAGIDKIAYVQTIKSNYTISLVAPGVEHFDNPSDHDFWVANLKVTANKLYVPPAPVTPARPKPLTKEQQLQAWFTDNKTSTFEQARLRAILALSTPVV